MKKSTVYFIICAIVLAASLIGAFVINSQTATGLGALTAAGNFTLCLIIAGIAAAAIVIGIIVVLLKRRS